MTMDKKEATGGLSRVQSSLELLSYTALLKRDIETMATVGNGTSDKDIDVVARVSPNQFPMLVQQARDPEDSVRVPPSPPSPPSLMLSTSTAPMWNSDLPSQASKNIAVSQVNCYRAPAIFIAPRPQTHGNSKPLVEERKASRHQSLVQRRHEPINPVPWSTFLTTAGACEQSELPKSGTRDTKVSSFALSGANQDFPTTGFDPAGAQVTTLKPATRASGAKAKKKNHRHDQAGKESSKGQAASAVDQKETAVDAERKLKRSQQENENLKHQLAVKDVTIQALKQQIQTLQGQVQDLRELPTGKISQIPIEDMLDIMHEYGSEVSEHAVAPPRKEAVKRASVVRQFRRWNPNFLQFFTHRQGKWTPKLGKEGELQRRKEARAVLLRTKQRSCRSGSPSSAASSD